MPSEATFSCAFKAFAEAQLPARLHAALIEEGYAEQLVGHISRDATAIAAPEKPAPKGTESVGTSAYDAPGKDAGGVAEAV